VLTGISVIFSWGGVLVGPPLFGHLLEASDTYALPWAVLAVLSIAVAAVLPWPKPLVDRT
jgi:hypothetical protein